jgi:RNA polymerase sigma-70 factor (ECF subfamily)
LHVVDTEGDFAVYSGETVGLGVSGLSARLSEPLRCSWEATVHVELPDGCELLAAAVVAAEEGDRKAWTYRLVFVDLDPADVEAIRVLLSSAPDARAARPARGPRRPWVGRDLQSAKRSDQMNYDDATDEKLMKTYYGLGDEAADDRAFEELERRWRRPLCASVRQRFPDLAEDAEDIVQKVLLKVAATREASTGRWDPEEGGVAPWLRTIVRNKCIDERRAQRPVSLIGDPRVLQRLHVHAPTDPLVEALLECMAELPEDDRELLDLKFVYGLTQREIARLIGVGEPSLSRRLHSIYARLRACLLERMGS